jgi:hypothetical protein
MAKTGLPFSESKFQAANLVDVVYTPSAAAAMWRRQ